MNDDKPDYVPEGSDEPYYDELLDELRGNNRAENVGWFFYIAIILFSAWVIKNLAVLHP